MQKALILRQAKKFAKEKLRNADSAHDFSHTERVLKMAEYIAAKETKIDVFIVRLSAILHDVMDYKLYKGNVKKGEKMVLEWLRKAEIPQKERNKILNIIKGISFRGGKNKTKIESREGKIVQDADRLDALGAIGIARAFVYGGIKGNQIYNPGVKIKKYRSVSQYYKSKSTIINHFYEKLLLLKDLMNTKTARKIAEGREQFMKEYLKRFLSEWASED